MTKVTTFAIPKTSKASYTKKIKANANASAKIANANTKTTNNAKTPSFSLASIVGNNAHMENAEKE